MKPSIHNFCFHVKTRTMLKGFKHNWGKIYIQARSQNQTIFPSKENTFFVPTYLCIAAHLTYVFLHDQLKQDEWASLKCGYPIIMLTLISFGGWLPVLHTNDGQTDLTLLINVGVVDFCLESDLRWLKGVLRGKDELNPKCSFVIWSRILEENKSL